mgnify:CR=1 FL=1|tara:strand:+ start:5715 stop:6104 length:390 start_codon:yes stop_codon:yes gene_type:complete
MLPIKYISDLPQPIRVMASNFYNFDLYEPEIYQVTADEFDRLAIGQEVVTQLLFWRSEKKFYAVLAGDADRKIMSEYIIHEPMSKKISILAFMPVDEHSIPLWNKKYQNKSLNRNILELEDVPQDEDDS